MNKSSFLIITILTVLTGLLSAQVNIQSVNGSVTVNTVSLEPTQVDVIDGVAVMTYSNSAAYINGSPYLNEEFVNGTMTALDGTEVTGLQYRYDIFGDKMQFILQGDTATIFKPLALRSIELGEHKFVYELYMLEANRVATGYFEVLEENKYLKILYKREIEIEQDIYAANYGGGGGTKEFRMKQVNSNYVKFGESAAQIISNKKGLLKVIPDHQDKVSKYIKEKRLSVKKNKDLQAIAIYYSSLKESGS